MTTTSKLTIGDDGKIANFAVNDWLQFQAIGISSGRANAARRFSISMMDIQKDSNRGIAPPVIVREDDLRSLYGQRRSLFREVYEEYLNHARSKELEGTGEIEFSGVLREFATELYRAKNSGQIILANCSNITINLL